MQVFHQSFTISRHSDLLHNFKIEVFPKTLPPSGLSYALKFSIPPSKGVKQ